MKVWENEDGTGRPMKDAQPLGSRRNRPWRETSKRLVVGLSSSRKMCATEDELLQTVECLRP